MTAVLGGAGTESTVHSVDSPTSTGKIATFSEMCAAPTGFSTDESFQPGRSDMLFRRFYMFRAALIALLLLAPGTAAADDTWSAGPPVRAEFDSGAGTIWLSEGAEARRVGESLVVTSGRALWAHSSAPATLSAGGVEVVLERGGVVGLDADAGAVDVYLGRGTAGRSEFGSGERITAGETSLPPSLTAHYGSDALEAAQEGWPGRPAGLVGVLEVAIDGQPDPMRFDPTALSLEIDLSGAAARVRARATFDLADAGPGSRLVVYQMLLPAGALLHQIEVTKGADTHEAFVGDAGTSGGGKLPADVPRHDFAAPLAERVPLGLVVDTGETLEIVHEWTQALEIDGAGSAMRLPAIGNAYGRQIGNLSITINGDDDTLSSVSWGRGAWARDGAQLTASLANAALEPGVEITLTPASDAPRVFAGRSPGVDDIFFAAETERSPPSLSQATDTIIIVDESGSMARTRLNHARTASLSLAAGLGPKSRVAIVRVGQAVESSSLETADPAHIRTLDGLLAGPALGGASRIDLALVDAARIGRDRADTSRPLQLVYFGDGEATMTTLPQISDALTTLFEMGASATVVQITAEPGGSVDSHWLASNWSVAVIQQPEGAHPAVTAARARGQFLNPLAPDPAWVADGARTSAIARWLPPPGWWGATELVTGRFTGPRPLFDLPGRAAVCRPDIECPLEIDLTDARNSAALAPVGEGLRLTQSLVDQTPAQRPEEEVESSRVLGSASILEVPGLRAAFELEYFRRRGDGAIEIQWIDFDNDMKSPAGGRITQRVDAHQVPPPTERDGSGGRVSSMPLDRDPWVRPFKSQAKKRVPSISDVMSGTINAPANVGYYADDPWTAATWITDSALLSARYVALEQIRATGKTGDAEAYVKAWHETALGSISQLQAVSNEYYSFSLYNEAQLANYDISVIDPYQAGSIGQKNAIEYFISEKRWYRAERALRRGLEQYASDDFYSDGLIRVLRATGRKKEVAEIEIERLEQQLATHPDDVDALERLLTQLVDAERADVARDGLERWKAATGDSPTYYALRASIASADGKKVEALEYLRKGVDSYPRSRISRARLVDALMDSGREEDALREAISWLEVDPENAWIAMFIGDVYTRRGDHKGAMTAYGRIIEIAPDQAVGYVKVGDAYFNMGDEAAASNAYDLALGIDPGSLATNLRIMEAAAEAGDFERAKKAYELLSSVSYENYDVTQARQETYYQLLSRWHAEAVYQGDDVRAEELFNQMMSTGVVGGYYYYGQQGYAVRAAFVPDTSRADVLIDMRVVEPGGLTLSYIMPYNNALGSQLFSNTGKSGPGPRVYLLPTVEDGTFEIEIELDGPDDHGPLSGRLYIHKAPQAFTEYWERHDVVLNKTGDTFRVSFTAEGKPSGNATAPRLDELLFAPTPPPP